MYAYLFYRAGRSQTPSVRSFVPRTNSIIYISYNFNPDWCKKVTICETKNGKQYQIGDPSEVQR